MTTETEVQPLNIPDAAPPYPTADDIVAAFRRHGIRPKTGSLWGLWPADAALPEDACAVGILLIDTYGKDAPGKHYSSREREQGLANGFDNWRADWLLYGSDDAYDAGYATGQAVRRWAFHGQRS